MYLFSENRLRLATIALLFSVVSPSTFGSMPFLRFLILCHFMKLVNFAFLTKSSPLFRDIHLKINNSTINWTKNINFSNNNAAKSNETLTNIRNYKLMFQDKKLYIPCLTSNGIVKEKTAMKGDRCSVFQDTTLQGQTDFFF